MKTKVLVITNTNWADEMDITGFCILEKDDFQEKMDRIEKWIREHGSFNWSIGTNESIEVDTYELKRFKICEDVPESLSIYLKQQFSPNGNDHAKFGHTFSSLYEQFLDNLEYHGYDEDDE